MGNATVQQYNITMQSMQIANAGLFLLVMVKILR